MRILSAHTLSLFLPLLVSSPAIADDDWYPTLEEPKKPNVLMKAVDGVLNFISPDVDTTYIEPQKYNMTAMAQTTMTLDRYTLSAGNDYSVTVAQSTRTKVGPYLGWRWLFLGYTFDITVLDILNGNTDINFNAYSSAIGINLLYRRLDNYKIKSAVIDGKDYTNSVKNVFLPGTKVDVEGINLYYVLNNKRYSHQAAYSQTNRQLRSAGSLIVGTGYNHNKINADWKEITRTISQKTGLDVQFPEGTKIENNIDYRSVSGSIGYGYNWVFSRNWLVGAQFIGSASYFWREHEKSEIKEGEGTILANIGEFISHNFTFDAGIKLGIVWNTSQWFAGTSVILNSNNYHDGRMWASNNYGTFNFYVGYNFWSIK